MNFRLNKFYLLTLFLALSNMVSAQNYTILGGATSFGGCNCYRLTVDAENQSGAIFQNQTINLNNSFDYSFDIFLGCNNGSGADGLTFALTSNPNGLGSAGGGLGYAGGSQPYSIAVEFDTYQNTGAGDPGYAHIGIHSGGNINHNVAAPVSALTNNGNIDDCQSHTVRVVWNVNTSRYIVYFDGVIRQDINLPNIVATYFNGNPIVNWGWTAATGGGTNEQRVCVKTTSSWVAGVNYQSCNRTMQFSDISTSNVGSVLSWSWNFGDGGTSTLQNPSHTYAANGTYPVSLTITDVNGCPNVYSKSVTINPPITLTPTLTQPPCNGGLNGAVTITPSGGFGPTAGYGGFMYSFNGGSSTSINTLNGGAGTYNVSVTDGVCSATGNYTLSEPSPLTATVTKTDASCNLNNGSATVTIAGGTGPYQGISWGSGFPAGATVNNLYPGTYIVDFKDANLCSSLLQYKAVIGSLPCGITSSVSTVNVNCFGKNTGSATLAVTGQTNPVTVNWSNGGTGYTISNLIAGSYTYTYSDGAGANFNGTVTITQPPAPMTASVGTINTSCAGINDGQATISVTSGGNPSYTYLWSNGQTTNGLANLAPGPLSVTVTDSKGCTATSTGTITGPPALNLNITKVNDSCYQSNTGSALATVSGGNPAYTYYWDNISSAQNNLSLGAGTYRLTVTDSKGCTITGNTTITEPAQFTHTLSSQNIQCFGQNTGSINIVTTGGQPTITYTWNPNTAAGSNPTGLAAGKYNVTIKDGNNCKRLDSATIIQPASALTATSSHTNVTCNGLANGTLTLTVGGGTVPYTYLGNPVPPGTTTVPGRTPGTYAGNVTDANGCTVAVSEVITEPAVLAATETHVNVGCNGASTGSIDVTVTGGTTPYTYNWGGVTTEDRSGLPIGTYTVTVTDANNCTTTVSATLTQPAALALSETHVNVLCRGGSTGAIDVTASGGALPYTYSWTSGPATEDLNAIPAGTYILTLTDANLCTKSISIAITEPATVLTATSSHTNVTCNGANDGTLTLNVGGGTAPYTFLGNPVPAGSTTVPGRAPGTYAGNVTDANGCTVALTETITEPAVLAATETHVPVSCNGASTGSIDVTVTGGTTPYTYNWGTVTTEDRSGLGAGTYGVTITDAKNCTTTLSVTITEPGAITLAETHVNVLCNGGATGSIDVTVGGGVTPYGYAWSSGPSTEDITGLVANTYILTVTDANQCTKTISVVITEPTVLTATSSHTDVTCNGANDGTLTLTVGGGTAPYTFLGNPVPAGSTTVPGRAPGTYAGNLTDANGCTVALTETITEPAVLAATETHVNVGCNGASTGSIDVTVTGGTTPYTYNWGAVTTEDRSGLGAGTYGVTITDAKNCTTTLSVTITEPGAITLAETHVNVLCNGGATGSIDVTVGGGVTPYGYAWSSGPATEDITGLVANTYILTITDANQCTKTISVVVTEPTILTATSSHTDVTCNGAADGTLTLTVGGGTAPYTFLGNPVPAGSTTVPGRAPGIYAGNVTDANGCTVALNETITEPAVLAATETHVNVGCNGASTGSIDVTVTGGTTPYTYNWGILTTEDRSGLIAGTYGVTITDAKNCTTTLSVTITEPGAITLAETHVDVLCNGGATGSIDITVGGGVTPYGYAWSSGPATEDITGLVANTYILTVTDANQCTKTISVVITEPTLFTATSAHTDVTCNGAADGTLTLTVGGGTAPYNFLGNPVPAGTTTLPGQGPNTYAGSVTDANGCTVAVTETITEPAAINVTETHVPVSCNGASTGSIDVTVAGGIAPYSYNWGAVTTEDLSGLAAGTYNLTVTDANNCTQTLTVTISEPQALLVTETHLDLPCFGSGTGSIDITASGGVTPYTYAWSDAPTTEDRTGIPAATYIVTVTDANNCTKTISVVIIEPAVLTASTSHTDVKCYGAANGTITITVGGGTAPFTFLGNPVPAGTSTVGGLAPNTYAGNVTDARGCTAAVSETITEPQPQSLVLNSTDNTCNGGINGDASANFVNATGAVSYQWTGNRSGSAITGLPAGTYTVTATDANSCTLTNSVTINEPAPQVLPVTATDATCFGGTGSATANPNVGTGPYTYTWTAPGAGNTQTITPVAGTYSVTAADASSCRQVGTFTINEPTQITTGETHSDALCSGGATGSITITATGGTPGAGYTYAWQPNVSTTNTASGVPAGSYSVTVSDGNGCSKVQTATVAEPAPVTVSATSTPTACFGDLNGTITATAGGGTTPYSFVASDGFNSFNSANGNFNGLTGGSYSISVTDANGCTGVNTVNINQPTEIVSDITATNARCFNAANGTLLLTTSGGNPTYSYTYSNNQTNTSGFLSGLDVGNYSVTVTDSKGCSSVEVATITEPDSVTIYVSPSPTVIDLGESIELSTNTNQSGTIIYQWSPAQGLSCTDCDNPTFTGIYSQSYTVTAVTDSGCTGTGTFEVKVVSNYDLYIPNLFSPNDDGQNDTWQIYGNAKAVKRFEVQVFNRWGELVYQSNDPSFVWDGYSKGVKLNPDVYVYIAKYTWLDNHTNNEYKGTLTLIR